MLSEVEKYYLSNLKGKSKGEILREIRRLKGAIGYYKSLMESPMDSTGKDAFFGVPNLMPFNRMCIERAKKALNEIGCIYRPSKSDIKDQLFQDNIKNISKISFSIIGFPTGYSKYVVTIDEKNIHFDEDHSFENKENLINNSEWHLDRNDFLDGLRELHLGEWKNKYNLEKIFFTDVDDVKWSLEIEFSNKISKKSFFGNGMYPYNFDNFRALFSTYDIICYNYEVIEDGDFYEFFDDDFEEYI